MANWILFGMLLGIVTISGVVLCWQVVWLILDVRGILRTVNQLTDRLDPTIQEVNQILHKSNQAMDEAGNNYKKAEKGLGEAKETANELTTKAKHWAVALKVGFKKSVEVLKSGGTPEPETITLDAESASPVDEELVQALQ